MKTKRPAWYKQDSNTYRCGQFTITRETGANKFWVVKFAGKTFAKTLTLAEAKELCK